MSRRKLRELEPVFLAHIRAYLSWANDTTLVEKVKFKFLGEIAKLPTEYRLAIQKLERSSRHAEQSECNILLGYGGQQEIVAVINDFAKKNEKADIKQVFKRLSLKKSIDLIIRSGNEKRLSNFPLFQAAYAEVIFEEKLYPEIEEKDFQQYLSIFSKRKRRFGK